MKISKDNKSSKWFDYGEDEKYLLVFSPEINFDTYANAIDGICKDWKGVFGENSKPVECNRNNKIVFLATNDGLQRFAWMLTIVQDLTRFWNLEEVRKNLKKS